MKKISFVSLYALLSMSATALINPVFAHEAESDQEEDQSPLWAVSQGGLSTEEWGAFAQATEEGEDAQSEGGDATSLTHLLQQEYFAAAASSEEEDDDDSSPELGRQISMGSDNVFSGHSADLVPHPNSPTSFREEEEFEIPVDPISTASALSLSLEPVSFEITYLGQKIALRLPADGVFQFSGRHGNGAEFFSGTPYLGFCISQIMLPQSSMAAEEDPENVYAAEDHEGGLDEEGAPTVRATPSPVASGVPLPFFAELSHGGETRTVDTTGETSFGNLRAHASYIQNGPSYGAPVFSLHISSILNGAADAAPTS